MKRRVARWLATAVGSILRKIQGTMKLGRLNLYNCRMFTVPDIGNDKSSQQTRQAHRRHSSIPKATRGSGWTSCAELKQAAQTILAGCDMIYTPIGKRDIRGTICVRFQKSIVNTLRCLLTARLCADVGFNLVEKPLLEMEIVLDLSPLLRGSLGRQNAGDNNLRSSL